MSEGRRRSGGRRGHGDAVKSNAVAEPAYIKRGINIFQAWNDAQIDRIMARGEEIVETIGVNVTDNAEALELFAGAGAKIEGDRVKIKGGILREIIQTAPSEFTQHARNPERNVVLGGNNTVLSPNYGSPFVRRGDEERRYGTIQDFQDLVKLAYLITGLASFGWHNLRAMRYSSE